MMKKDDDKLKKRCYKELSNEQKERCRATSRIRQQRYRDRKKATQEETKSMITTMQQDIQLWKSYHDKFIQNVVCRTRTTTILLHLKIVEVFFRIVLRNGLQPSPSTTRDIQERFIRLHFAPNVIMQSGLFPRGPEFILQQMERYAWVFPKLNFEIMEMHAISPTMIVAVSEGTFPITRKTIAALFPHMLQIPLFIDLVVGKTLQMKMWSTFLFHSSRNQIIRLTFDMDWLNAWMDLLRNEHISLFLQMAHYSNAVKFHVIDVEEEHMYPDISRNLLALFNQQASNTSLVADEGSMHSVRKKQDPLSISQLGSNSTHLSSGALKQGVRSPISQVAASSTLLPASSTQLPAAVPIHSVRTQDRLPISRVVASSSLLPTSSTQLPSIQLVRKRLKDRLFVSQVDASSTLLSLGVSKMSVRKGTQNELSFKSLYK